MHLLSNNKKAGKIVSNLPNVELYNENYSSLLLDKSDDAFQSEDVEDAYFLSLVIWKDTAIFQLKIISLNLKI